MAMAPTGQQKVRLRCDDGVVFEIKREAAMKSTIIAACLDEEKDSASEPIPVSGVKSSVLAKVVEFCEHYAGVEQRDSDFHLNPRVWREDPLDDQLMDVDLETRFAILNAANFLDIKELRELCCRTVANMMRGKSVEEIRKTFNVKNDYIPEEEQAVRAEIAWAFQNNN